MKLSLTEHDISIKESKDGTFYYRLNGDLLVEGFETKEEALFNASEKLKKYLRTRIRK